MSDRSNDAFFDYQAGLAQLGGNEALLHKLLAQFSEQMQGEYASLPGDLLGLSEQASAEAVSPTTWDALQKTNHALKGVAGNLALTPLFEQAQIIDQCLKKQALPSKSRVEAFNQAFENTRTGIAQLESPQSSQTASAASETAAPRDALIQGLNSLLARVEQSEFIDDDTLSSLQSQLPTQETTAWQALTEALDDFEFDQARPQIEALISRLSASQS